MVETKKEGNLFVLRLVFIIFALAMSFIRILATILAKVFEPIRRNATFFVFMYVLGLACGWIELHEWQHVYPNLYLELFLDIYVLCLFLLLFPRKLRRWVRGFLYVVFYALAIVDVYCFVKFKSVLNPTMLLLVGETNSKEATEFLGAYVSADVLTSNLGWILLIILVHVLWSVRKGLLRMMRVSLPDCSRASCEWLRPVAGLLTLVLLLWSGASSIGNKQAMVRLASLHTIGEIERELTRKDCAKMYEPPYRLAFSIFANRLTAQQISKLIATKDKAVVDSCSYSSPNIVLIIGESYNKHHSQLYGYPMETTPRQLERSKSGQLVTFTDVVTPWNLTSFVFKLLFSTYTVGDEGEWCDYPLFTELFRKAGYHVTFLTNQFLPQAKEQVYDFSGGFFLNNPELSEAQFDARNSKLHVFDDALLFDYEGLKDEMTEHNLTIFHLIGQHVFYRTRCPNRRKKFKPSDYDRPEMTKKDLRTLSDYDNGIMFNDSVVNAIIGRFEDDDAIVLYVADHGEEVFGPGAEHTFGRMHTNNITARLAHEEFEVPMWIWCSHKYMVNHPEISRQIVLARNRRFMTDALPHLLLYLGGIHCPDYRRELNLLDDAYREGRPRILKGLADYDKLTGEEEKWPRTSGQMQ